ncbi:MAG: isopeptide-forming domain-containing fimbrial protein, partial [bacterium]|nr:isopeptide-forming domain-containing fimbrial protein [bacterium]
SKGVAQVNGLPAVPNPPNTDHVQVQESDVVTWRIDVSNIGSSAGGSNVPVRNVSVVDTLPTGITCAAVSSISDSGTCTGSTLNWTSGTIAAGASKTFTFDMAVPALVSADISYTNTVNVPSYESENNNGTWSPQSPTNVTDVSDVFTADITFTKTGTTSLDLPNNNAGSQFTVGEQITYTLDGTVPAQTTAYSGVMTDTLPSGLQAVSCAAQFSPDGTVGSLTSALPVGTTLSSCAAAAVTLTLPATYTNTNPTAAQLFRMTITAVVLGGSYTHGQVKTNSATFVGTNFNKSSSKAATVVIPNPQIAKSNSNPSSGGSVVAGAPVTFTLAVTNPSASPARPVSYDTIVVDCLPSGIGSPAYGTLPGGVTSDAIVAGDGTNGCVVGTTRLGWSVGAVATGATVTLTYTASIDAGQAGSVTFTNTATVTGSSLDNGVRDSSVEGVYTNSSSSSIRSNNGTLTKSVTPTSAAVGETTTWTVTAEIPANLQFWGAAVIDRLPAGVDASSVATTSVTCSQPLAPLDCAGTLTPSFGTDLAQASSPTRIGWLLGDLSASTQIRTVKIIFTAVVDDIVANAAGATITNSATFNSNPTGHGTPTNAGSTFEDTSDPATANVTVLEPSLSVLKSVSTGTPTPGSPFNYTITVTNASGANVSAAYTVVIEDVIPTGVIVDAATISNSGTIAGASSTTGGGTITWNVAGPIAPGASFDRTYSATIPSGTTTGTFVNTVDIPSYDSFTSNPRTYDNVTPDTATVTVSAASADMSITKTHGTTPVPSETVTFTLKVRNLGPSDAVGPITVVDTLPTGLTYISAGSSWSCSPVGQVITCLLLPLAPVTGMVAGSTAPDLIISTWVSSAIAPASWTNSATVSSTSTDPVPGNNTATDVVNVVPAPPTPGPGPSVSPTPSPTATPTPTPTPSPSATGGVIVGGGKPQKPTKPLNLGNINIKPGKWQNLIVSSLTTNAGNKVQASVQCRYATASDLRATRNVAGQPVPAGDITLCQLRNHRGMIQVRVVVPGPVVVHLILFAPARNGFSAYHNDSTWIARGNI